MKRKVIFGAVVTALICVCIALNAKILEPKDFTGAWYRAEDGMLYIFEDGIIECADKEIIVMDIIELSQYVVTLLIIMIYYIFGFCYLHI